MEAAHLPPTVWVPILVALLGAVASLAGYIATRLAKLNARVDALERRDRLSWLYIRSLIDHAYRHNATPLPDPPAGWLDALNGD